MLSRNTDFPDKIVKTWKWPVDKADYHVPDGIDPRFFQCRRHGREREDLLPFRYEGQDLYVCRFCGDVYEVMPETKGKKTDPLRIWHVLFQQPYNWNYIRTSESLTYHFVHECEGLTTHPLLDAHGGDDRTDSLELIARFFMSVLREDQRDGVRFFRDNRKNIRAFQEDNALILSSGKYPAVFPWDRFCTYREEPDCLSLEVSHSWEENIYGFTLDLNEENFEKYQSYCLIVFSFLCSDESDLPDRIREWEDQPLGREPIPNHDGDLSRKREIVRDPFGLKGFFVYEKKELTRSVI
jgi:hypothetical protein